jgi:hypothetical protein
MKVWGGPTRTWDFALRAQAVAPPNLGSASESARSRRLERCCAARRAVFAGQRPILKTYLQLLRLRRAVRANDSIRNQACGADGGRLWANARSHAGRAAIVPSAGARRGNPRPHRTAPGAHGLGGGDPHKRGSESESEVSEDVNVNMSRRRINQVPVN